jgi:hypothetical protein
MRRLLVAEASFVPRGAHLLLVAEPFKVFGADVHRQRCRRGRMRGLGGHAVIVSVFSGELRPAPARLRSFAYPQVISRAFA